MANWLKIEGGKAVQSIVLADGKDAAFIASLGLTGQWAQSDAAGIGWNYANGEFSPPETPVIVPASVTRRQGRIALLRAGKLETCEAIVQTGGLASQIEYEADTWERANPYLCQVWALAGGTEAELDALFIEAAGL